MPLLPLRQQIWVYGTGWISLHWVLSLLRVFCNTSLPPWGLSTPYPRRRRRTILIGCSRCGLPGVTWHLILYVGRWRAGVESAIRFWRLGACGSCQWGRSASRQPWPVAWLLFISTWRSGYSNVVLEIPSQFWSWNIACQSSGYRDRTVGGTCCQCLAFGVRRISVTISGVASVGCRVQRWLRPISNVSRIFFKISDCW